MFLAKYDVLGNCIWAKKIGGNVGEPKSIKIDNLGNLYITGSFFSTAKLDSITLTSYGIDDIFVAKYSADGKCIWAKNAGGKRHDSGSDIAIDSFGNCFIIGNVLDEYHFGNKTFTSDDTDIFVAKYDTFGNIVFVEKVTCASISTLVGNGIALDSSGAVFVTGFYEGKAFFGSNTLIGAGSINIFLAKLSNIPLGVAENNSSELTTFVNPNPFSTSSTIHLQKESINSSLTVYDIFGRAVKSIDFSGNEITIDRDNLSNGLYFYKIGDDTILSSGKLIVID